MSVDFYPTFSDNNKARSCGKVANMFSPSNRVKLPNQEVFACYEVKRAHAASNAYSSNLGVLDSFEITLTALPHGASSNAK